MCKFLFMNDFALLACVINLPTLSFPALGSVDQLPPPPPHALRVLSFASSNRTLAMWLL